MIGRRVQPQPRNKQPEHRHDASGSPLVDSALHSVKAGDLCQAYCFDLLAKGDTSVADCARSVESLRAVCGTLAGLAAQNSSLLPHYAAVAREACDSCEKELPQNLYLFRAESEAQPRPRLHEFAVRGLGAQGTGNPNLGADVTGIRSSTECGRVLQHV